MDRTSPIGNAWAVTVKRVMKDCETTIDTGNNPPPFHQRTWRFKVIFAGELPRFDTEYGSGIPARMPCHF